MDSEFVGGRPLGKAVADASYSNKALVDEMAAYKRRIAGNYRPLRPDEIATLPPTGLLASRKIDGETWFLVSNEQGVFLLSPTGKAIHGQMEAVRSAEGLAIGTVIAGELYSHRGGARERVGDLAAEMAKGEKAATSAISFAAYDLVKDAGTLPSPAYKERHARLLELVPTTPQLSVVDAEEIKPDGVRARYESEVASGASEGLVLRLPTGLIYKLKPTITIDAAIIAYTAKADSPDMARSILLGLMHPEGEFQVLGGCGNLGSDEDRKTLLLRLKGSKADSSIRYASDGGGLYTFVKPEMVVEVRVTDLQAEKSDGSVSTTTLAAYGADGWRGKKFSPCPRLIHPVLERLREDKSLNATDIRFSQVEPYMAPQAGNDHAPALPASTVIRREAWTKEFKGQVAVRKLLAWKTNKEAIDPSFPAYVVSWTDYSPGRASPLDREVKIAPDEDIAMEIAKNLIEANIKKGWEKV